MKSNFGSIANLRPSFCLYRWLQIKALQDTWIVLAVSMNISRTSVPDSNNGKVNLICAHTNKQKELKPENIPENGKGVPKNYELASCKSQMFCTFYALKLFCSDA